MRILLAIDGSACSEVVVEEVASRPWPAKSEFRVLTAYELPVMTTSGAWAISADYWNRVEEAVSEHAQKISDAGREKLSKIFGASFSVTSHIMAGSASSAILEHAESWEADLIVLGSHGYSTWKRFLLGSVSQAVVSHAKCSVEVVRSKGNPAKGPGTP